MNRITNRDVEFQLERLNKLTNNPTEYWTDNPGTQIGDTAQTSKERTAKSLKKKYPEGEITKTTLTVKGKKYILPSIVKGTQQ